MREEEEELQTGSSSGSAPVHQKMQFSETAKSAFEGSEPERTAPRPEQPFVSPSDGSKETEQAHSSGKIDSARSKVSVLYAGVGDSVTDDDNLGFELYVDAIARFLDSPFTRPPLAMSIEGKWGSGKSSFMKQLQTAIRKVATTPPRIINFNAWRHDKEDALWAAFALSFIEQVTAQLPWRQKLLGWVRLFWKRFTWSEGWSQAVRAMFLSLTILACALLIPILMYVRGQTWAESLALQLEKIGSHSEHSSKSGNSHSAPIPGDNVPSNDNDKAPVIRNALPPLIKAGGWTGSLALFLYLLYSITRILGNPLKINLRKYVRSPDYEGKTAFIENFHRDFKRILDAYIGSAKEGDTGEIANKLKTFIFIDDLDRCDVPKAAELMSAINLMISDDERLIFIIGMDRQKVAAGVAWKYKDLVQFLQEGTASGITDSQLVRNHLRFGYEFLEKFIQLPFKLPAPSEDSLKDFLQKISQQGIALAGERKDNVETASLRAQRQQVLLNIEHDSEIVRAMSLLIASTFDQNPRRMKQFVNLFRLKLYLASSTGLLDKPDVTPEQLGKLTAILLRWPDFMDAWLAKRELLGDLEIYAMSLKKDQSKRNVNAAGWFIEEDLLQLLQIGAFPTTTHGESAMDPAYSLQNVDADKVLRVMPVPGKNWEPPQPTAHYTS
jgi:hypothetical protein